MLLNEPHNTGDQLRQPVIKFNHNREQGQSMKTPVITIMHSK